MRRIASLALLLLLSGCEREKPGPKAAECETPRDEITVALAAAPNTLDWNRSNESSWQNYPVIHALMRGLTALDESNQPVPGLAEKWEIEPGPNGGQRYTFHLKRGVTWSDGKTPLTAHDFVFGWRRAMRGNEGQEMSDLLGADAVLAIRNDASLTGDAREKKLLEAVQKLGVEAVDDHTLRVTLKAPRSYFLARVAYVYTFFPAPSALLVSKSEDDVRDYFDEPANGNPVTVGAFTVESWDRVGKIIKLRSSDPAGSVKRLRVIQAELAALLYDQCRVDFVAMDDPAALRSPPADLADRELLSTYWLGMNTAALDRELRLAIAYAIDRKAAGDGLLPEWRPAFGYLPSDLPGGVAPGDPLAKDFPVFDLEKAKAHLAKSKYDGRALTLLVKGSGTFMPETGIADAIRRQLEAAGIKATLVTTSDFAADVKKPDGTTRHDLFLKRVGADYAHPQTFFTAFQKNGTHYTGWDKLDGGKPMAAFEALLAQGAAETDARKMTEAYTKAQNILLAEQAVLVPIYYPNRYYRKRAWIQGLGVDPFNFLTFRTMHVVKPGAP